MMVLAYDPYLTTEEVWARGAEKVELDELLELSDFVHLNCPLTPETERLIGREQFARMKPTALLVNTSRAGLIEPGALVAVLQAGRPGMAALDVFEEEPLRDPSHPLLNMDNVLCTPHIGYVTVEEWDLQFTDVFDQVNAFAAGKPINVVNP